MARYIKALMGANEDFVLIISDSKSVVEKATEIHGLNPVASAACGRLITGAKLMAQSLKSEGARISVGIEGDGSIGRLMAFADKDGILKIKVENPEPEMQITADGKLDVGHAVGKNGYVSVTRDSDSDKPYTGKSRLISGEIAEDLAHYYLESEQQPSAIALGVFVNPDGSIGGAGGLMLHVLPDASEEDLSKIEHAMTSMKPISSYLLETQNLEKIIETIFQGIEYRILESGEYEYDCDCSKSRAERALASIGEDERKEMIEEDGSITLHCDYCGNDYVFNE